MNVRRATSEWRDPLSSEQLATVLRALAEVAKGDADHDYGTVLDVYNDQQRRHARSPLSLAESEQIISVVRASIAGAQTASVWQSDLLFLDRHLFEARRVPQSGGLAVSTVLEQLLQSAALFAEGRPDASVGQRFAASQSTAAHQGSASPDEHTTISPGEKEGK
jgi:hypothetical protein